ncbi:hypothetical protein ACO0QE_002648 [Hanseniaspora vineae]
MSDSKDSVTFCLLSELSSISLKIHIDKLIGKKPLLTQSTRFQSPELTRINSNVNLTSELFATVQVYDNFTNRELSIPVTTNYKPFKNTRKWAQWLEIPIALSLLNEHSKMLITLWEYGPEGSKIIFHKLDSSLVDHNSMTLKSGTECIKFDVTASYGNHEIVHNEHQKLLDKYIMGEIAPEPWLDHLSLEILKKKSIQFDLKPNEFVLFIHYPYYEVPIVVDEKQLPIYSNIPNIESFKLNTKEVLTNSKNNKQNKEQDLKQESIQLPADYNSLKFFDPDQYNSDPVEEKFRRLERSSNKNFNSTAASKPDASKREILNKIINYPPGTELTAHEKALIWKYRYYCMSNKRALTKFLQSATLNDENEKAEVVRLMDLWIEIGIEDAIELLGPRYTLPFVREYAVKRLEKSTDDEIQLYLLQLVQALCLENVACTVQEQKQWKGESDQLGQSTTLNTVNLTSNHNSLINSTNSRNVSRIKPDLLVSEYPSSTLDGNNLDFDAETNGEASIFASRYDGEDISFSSVAEPRNQDVAATSSLASFLIKRAVANEILGNYFFWYLKSESKDSANLLVILEAFFESLTDQQKEKVISQVTFVDMLRDFCIQIKSLRDTTQKKTSLLHHLVTHRLKPLLRQKTVHLPLDPSIIVTDVIPNQCKVFKSSLSPLKITFKTKDNKSYSLMYKVGDDLRQDQLVVQIIKLMDVLLKNDNVDLKLTPYKIVTTGPDEGAIEFIPNETISNILSKYHGIASFLANYKPEETTKKSIINPGGTLSKNSAGASTTTSTINVKGLKIDHIVMDNFIKSCAGYCVITYILGVGDRHLDNLLITPEGRFFHADFGYILGRDPKPFPPLMKLPPQVIDAFGGADSANYNKFRSYCFVAYSILRKNAGLILNLFELMKNSQIPDIKLDPESAVLKVKEKFCLDMSEEEAIIHFQNLINVSVNALLPLVIDHLHNLTQYWRA